MKFTVSSKNVPTRRATSRGASRPPEFDRPSWKTSNTRGLSYRRATSIPLAYYEIVMIGSELWFIYALVFGAVLLGIQGLYWGVFKERREQRIVNRRLALTAQLANPAEVLEALRKERGIEFLAGIPSLRSFNDLIVQSGVRLSGAGLLLAISVLAVLA